MENVWKTFTNLARWEDWNTVIRKVRSDQKGLKEGADLKCSFYPFLFPIEMKIEIERVIPHDLIVWSSEKKGLFAHHEFLFREQGKGVLVVSRETFTGMLAKGAGFLLPVERIRTLTKTFLKDLKRACES